MLKGKNNYKKQLPPPKIDALMLSTALAACEIVPSTAIEESSNSKQLQTEYTDTTPTAQNTDEALNCTSHPALSLANGESDKQLETEEQTEEYDTLSTTSTIYSEVDYLREGDTDDEEDRWPIKNTDEALHCTSSSVLSSMVSDWFATWRVSDGDLEKLLAHKESDAGRLEPGRLEPPFAWIHVYAYFNKKKRYGGYGVIVRNELGEPIIASAQFSEDGCCFHCQAFKGINAGAILAEKGGRSHLHILCNSIKLPYNYCYTHFCTESKCKENICKFCDAHIKMAMGCDRTKDLVLKLRQKNVKDFQCDWGIAVHYLAKLAKKNRLDGSSETGNVIQPAGLPLTLKHIIWGEGFYMARRKLRDIFGWL